MTLAQTLTLAKQATQETIGEVQERLFPELIDLGESEIEQVFQALKTATNTSLRALRRDWQTYLKTNGLGSDSASSSKTVGDILVNLALESGLELWHDSERNPWTTLTINSHCEHHPLKSKSAKRFIAGLYLAKQGKAAPSQAIQDALNSMEAQAVFHGQMHPTFVRLAPHSGNLYLDLCNDSWEVIEITPSGWAIRSSVDLPIRFRRTPGLAALPSPTRDGRIDDLATLLNLKPSSSVWKLMVAWLLGTLQGSGSPYPVLVLTGEQGSGKSTIAKMLKNLIDPNISPLRVLPREERDLLISAVNGHVLAFDNLSGLFPGISDSLCRLSTGGGLSVRQLYSDSEETLLDAMRPVILNGIDDFVKRQDLVSRSILIGLPTINEESRKTESELWEHYEALRPNVLGALLDATSYALANKGRVNLPKKPRLADFAVWVTAAEPALGWQTGEFMQVFDEAQKTLVSNALEAEAVAIPLIELAEIHSEWVGSAGEMLHLLKEIAHFGDEKRMPEGWPKTPEKLSSILSRLIPALRAEGVHIERLPKTKHSRLWKVCRVETKPSPPSPADAISSENSVIDAKTNGDGRGDGLSQDDGFTGATATKPSPQLSSNKARAGGSGDGGDSSDGFVSTPKTPEKEVRWYDVD